MFKVTATAVIALGTFISPIQADEQTVTLSIENMYCAACPYIVRESLAVVAGVVMVAVSYEDKTAVVTFDDGQTDVATLIKATTDAGYPSTPKS